MEDSLTTTVAEEFCMEKGQGQGSWARKVEGLNPQAINNPVSDHRPGGR